MAERNVFVDMIMGAGKHLLTRAANGAAEAVLDEVHGVVKEADRRISKAKKRVSRKDTVVIEDAEFEVSEVHENKPH
jgi:hypothetical protein